MKIFLVKCIDNKKRSCVFPDLNNLTLNRVYLAVTYSGTNEFKVITNNGSFVCFLNDRFIIL